MAGSGYAAGVNIFDWFSHSGGQSVPGLNVVDLVQVSGGGDRGKGLDGGTRHGDPGRHSTAREGMNMTLRSGMAMLDGLSAWLWQQDDDKRKKLSPELSSHLSSRMTVCAWISTSGR